MIKIILIATFLLASATAYSQISLTEIDKYQKEEISNKIIKKTRRFFKIPKERHLSVFFYHTVCMSSFFEEKPLSANDLLSKFELIDAKYVCDVYDDTLNIVATSYGSKLDSYFEYSNSSEFIEYIIKLKPKYIFKYDFQIEYHILYFCYFENGDIVFVHESKDGKGIVSYSLSEMEDWDWLKDPSKIGK